MPGWDKLKEIVRLEIIQKKEEGADVQGFFEEYENAGDDEQKLKELYDKLFLLEPEQSIASKEPSELEEIRKQRTDGLRKLKIKFDENKLMDKFYGAWIGRCAGCALGKPLEAGPFMAGTKSNPGWKNVKLWFEGADAWPIKGYVPIHSRAQEEHGINISEWCTKSTRENIKYMESDDDIRYTILGLWLMEQKGLEWDSWDVGVTWHCLLPYAYVCTAETQAYYNFANVVTHMDRSKPSDWKEKINWVRSYMNPYREWIGAQIRVDSYGYCAAGNPELAAELAWRDASFSHVKNGIYGAMFMSALISAAFVEDNPYKQVEIALSEIPAQSRLAYAIKKAVEIASNEKHQVNLVEKIWNEFNHYHCVHTINNAALCAASIIFAQGDFEKAITTAVLGGWDTDCNGATVGSVMGAMLGASNIPDYWSAPLNDMIYSSVAGFDPISISECAKRTYEVFKKINRSI